MISAQCQCLILQKCLQQLHIQNGIAFLSEMHDDHIMGLLLPSWSVLISCSLIIEIQFQKPISAEKYGRAVIHLYSLQSSCMGIMATFSFVSIVRILGYL